MKPRRLVTATAARLRAEIPAYLATWNGIADGRPALRAPDRVYEGLRSTIPVYPAMEVAVPTATSVPLDVGPTRGEGPADVNVVVWEEATDLTDDESQSQVLERLYGWVEVLEAILMVRDGFGARTWPQQVTYDLAEEDPATRDPQRFRLAIVVTFTVQNDHGYGI